jgi:hypothetical protein
LQVVVREQVRLKMRIQRQSDLHTFFMPIPAESIHPVGYGMKFGGGAEPSCSRPFLGLLEAFQAQ